MPGSKRAAAPEDASPSDCRPDGVGRGMQPSNIYTEPYSGVVFLHGRYTIVPESHEHPAPRPLHLRPGVLADGWLRRGSARDPHGSDRRKEGAALLGRLPGIPAREAVAPGRPHLHPGERHAQGYPDAGHEHSRDGRQARSQGPRRRTRAGHPHEGQRGRDEDSLRRRHDDRCRVR
jgi:hypothetical protein